MKQAADALPGLLQTRRGLIANYADYVAQYDDVAVYLTPVDSRNLPVEKALVVRLDDG